MNQFNITSSADKEQILESVQSFLNELGLTVASHDFNRPWGGFFVMDEAQSDRFIECFFSHLKKGDLVISGKLSPKILVVAPTKRLSWQYHNRRAEIWKLIGGKAGVVTSPDDEELDIQYLAIGDIVELEKGQRHRLIGDANDWGVVAEIWQHTDAAAPSDEDDIVRLQDDFGRQ